MTPDEERLSRRYLEINTSSGWQSARRKERMDSSSAYDQINSAFEQWGERQQFQILRGRQRSLERGNTMRAALNSYTNNLVFGDAYQLNVQGADKKAMVRSEALPGVNAVVVSDLDLRDLVRNQILQNMDDARAELEYQLPLPSSQVEVEEILTYLKKAQTACGEWFAFIPAEDVQEALVSVNGVYSVPSS